MEKRDSKKRESSSCRRGSEAMPCRMCLQRSRDSLGDRGSVKPLAPAPKDEDLEEKRGVRNRGRGNLNRRAPR